MDSFIGVTPPDDIQQRIVRLQTAFACKLVVEPHITVKTQSGLTDGRVWLKPVENFLRQQTPFRVALTGLLTVPKWFWDEALLLGVQSPGIHKIHDDLLRLINPDEKLRHKYFEDRPYVPHLTLADRSYGISRETLCSMEAQAKHDFIDLPPFQVTFARIYQQANPAEPYTTLLDVPFRE
jgi:2'-5' RNA ligase